MRSLRKITLSLGALCLAAGCGGTDQQPEMPDPSVVDRSADDMGLPEAEPEPETAGGEGAPAAPVRVVAGERTPIEGAAPTIRITAPRNGQRIARGDVMLRLTLRNWPLEPEPGRHVHVIVDNEPYIAVRDVSQPINLNQLVQQNLGHELAQGTHVVRVFPSRGHHESVKTDGAFAVVVFHYGAPTEGFSFDPSAPLLTYSRPKGCNPAGERVLLDFYLSNVELSRDGHRVRYEIDGEGGEITEWVPHWIENLPIGEHTIRLTLVDAQGQGVPGPFNDTTRTITIAESCN
ncbi:MAG TPA: hypothetical protein VIL20_28380 [Sandaracinaceae bacterium]